jgi:small redox-active disulfide protein 2
MTTRIRILGPGCARCQALYENTRAAVEALGIDASIEKVEDLRELAVRGVMATPVLIVDDEVLVAGSVPNLGQLAELLEARV